jgi:hypothetical protein
MQLKYSVGDVVVFQVNYEEDEESIGTIVRTDQQDQGLPYCVGGRWLAEWKILRVATNDDCGTYAREGM